jgi:hypothetical protein
VYNSLSGGFILFTLNIKGNVLLEVEYINLGLSKGVNLCNGRPYYLVIISNSYSRWLNFNFVFNSIYGFY